MLRNRFRAPAKTQSISTTPQIPLDTLRECAVQSLQCIYDNHKKGSPKAEKILLSILETYKEKIRDLHVLSHAHLVNDLIDVRAILVAIIRYLAFISPDVRPIVEPIMPIPTPDEEEQIYVRLMKIPLLTTKTSSQTKHARKA